MPARQSWALSQEANKKSGVCAVCLAIRQLHEGEGKVHLHGPRNNRCPGSNQLPLQASAPASASQPVSSGTATERRSRNPIIGPSAAGQGAVPSAFAQPSSSGQLSGSGVSQSLSFQHPCLQRPSIKHIPKSARPTCASALEVIFRTIENDPRVVASWADLLNFGIAVLQVPARTGKGHNLSSLIKKRVVSLGTGVSPEQDVHAVPIKSSRKGSSRASAVRAKMEDGNVSAAVRILCSEESLAESNLDTLNKLKEKHPAANSNGSSAPLPSSVNTQALQVTENEVLKAVRSFPSGSAGGPDGIRPQHLVELVTCKESAPNFLPALTSFVNLLLRGVCPPEIRPVLFGGNLIALGKKSGGIRPIAVGYTWRRLAAKCANSYAVTSVSSYLSPIQLGAGIPGGCEAAVHATRRFVESMPADHCVVKLDFTNAFNCLNRTRMLTEVSKRIPELYNFCHLAYSSPSSLKFGKWSIESQEGVQQGDPLGPMLFCLTIHPLLSSLSSILTVGFLDDITLGGIEDTVARDVQCIIDGGQELGLKLNIPKCELITPSDDLPTSAILSSFQKLKPSQSNLLGAPLTTGSAMDDSLLSRLSDLKRAALRLKTLDSHDALTILRYSLSVPRLMHTLRSSPSFGHPLLLEFDTTLKECLCSVVNTDLTNTQWTQASLPVSRGGLGIRLASQLAPSAFLASAMGTRELQDAILIQSSATADISVDCALSYWSSGHNLNAPTGVSAGSQKNWDAPVVQLEHTRLLESLPSASDQARILAVSAKRSSDWLHAFPIASCGLFLENEAIRVAVGFRLGAKTCEPHVCPCGAQVDATGLHGLSCRRSSGRTSRHHNLNDLVWRALSRAGVPSSKEPVGLSRSDGKRPDGMTLVPWSTGKCAVWDVTVIDTMAISYLSTTSTSAGGAAEIASARKLEKYQDLASGYEVVPVAMETMGPMNSEGADFINGIGRLSAQKTGDQRETSFLWQRLSITLQRFNAVCFRGSFKLEDLE